jgi:hypothetical protein
MMVGVVALRLRAWDPLVAGDLAGVHRGGSRCAGLAAVRNLTALALGDAAGLPSLDGAGM